MENGNILTNFNKFFATYEQMDPPIITEDPLATKTEEPIAFVPIKEESPMQDFIKLSSNVPTTQKPKQTTSFKDKKDYAKTMYQYLHKALENNGFKRINDPNVQYRAYTNGSVVIDDIAPGNAGLNFFRQPRIIDFNLQTIPEWLEQGFKLKKGGRLIPKAQNGINFQDDIKVNDFISQSKFNLNKPHSRITVPLREGAINYNLIIQNLWKRENAQNFGFRNGKYYPYITPNGNLDVALGIDLGQNPQYLEEAKNGITKERAERIAMDTLSRELKYIDKNLSKYGSSDIPSNQKEGLLDMYWQLKNGLYKYQNLFKHLANNNKEGVLEESKVYYWPEGVSKNDISKRKFDGGRYNFRINTYFYPNQ